MNRFRIDLAIEFIERFLLICSYNKLKHNLGFAKNTYARLAGGGMEVEEKECEQM